MIAQLAAGRGAISVHADAEDKIDAVVGEEDEHCAQDGRQAHAEIAGPARPADMEQHQVDQQRDQRQTSFESQPQKWPQALSAQTAPRIVPAASRNTVIWIAV